MFKKVAYIFVAAIVLLLVLYIILSLLGCKVPAEMFEFEETTIQDPPCLGVLEDPRQISCREDAATFFELHTF